MISEPNGPTNSGRECPLTRLLISSIVRPGKMIQKPKSSGLWNFFGYLLGKDPQDEWCFQVNGISCRVLNGWRSGAFLYVNGQEKDRNKQQIALGGNQPSLSAKIRDSQGNESTLSIHVKALTKVVIQIRLNGQPIHDGFI